ncbi:MAG TPA: hypothetical protein VHZ29_04885 [Rhizomicrobium sp.]|nr:hypothetical protein [Rhizomicrobium sp.]
MNKFQAANSTLTFAVIAACGGGMSKWISDNPTVDVMELFRSHTAILLLWMFIILLKVKFWIDDNRYFGEDAQEKLGIRIFAFALAAFSMIFSSLAGLQIEMPNRSAELEIIGILISTAWIAVHLIEIKI